MRASPYADLSVAEARRTALAAQGFLDPPHQPPTMRTLMRTLSRTGVLQIDSVNVLQRAHYLPLFSRMGPYPTDLLHRAAGWDSAGTPAGTPAGTLAGTPTGRLSRPGARRLVEYWAHEAAFLPVEDWPLMRHRMATARTAAWGGPRRIAEDQPDLVRRVLEEVRRRGPVTARQVAADLSGHLPRRRDNWGWNWSEAKQALEFLFFGGEVSVARRNPQFERVYDLPERVLPAAVLALPTPDPADAHRELVRRAARSCGVATERSLRDYYRMGVAETRAAVADLVDSQELLPVRVAGWRQSAYLHCDARFPRRVEARALLSPFDPLVWERVRTEQLFGFHYRIEIYVPQERRVHGYYVLPFLLGDQLVARVDLRADRASGVLEVRGAFAEPDAPVRAAGELAQELRQLARWLGLGPVRVAARGDLATALAGSVGVG